RAESAADVDADAPIPIAVVALPARAATAEAGTGEIPIMADAEINERTVHRLHRDRLRGDACAVDDDVAERRLHIGWLAVVVDVADAQIREPGVRAFGIEEERAAAALNDPAGFQRVAEVSPFHGKRNAGLNVNFHLDRPVTADRTAAVRFA